MIATRSTSLDRLREAVRARVETGSLRQAARQVGMSPTGLRKFLAGGVPYQKSRRRLFDWLHRESAAARTGLPADGVSGRLAPLVEGLPPERRDAALEALVGTLRSLYGAHADAAPAWLKELAAERADGLAGEGAEP